jgi:hypothetical protein
MILTMGTTIRRAAEITIEAAPEQAMELFHA